MYTSVKMSKGNTIWNGFRSPEWELDHLLQAAQPTGKRKKILILTRGSFTFSFCEKEGRSLPAPQQHNNPHFEPMRNCHNVELWLFSSDLLFKTTLFNFLLRPSKSWPFLCLFRLAYLWLAVVCLFLITIPLLFPNGLALLVKQLDV